MVFHLRKMTHWAITTSWTQGCGDECPHCPRCSQATNFVIPRCAIAHLRARVSANPESRGVARDSGFSPGGLPRNDDALGSAFGRPGLIVAVGLGAAAACHGPARG